MAFVYQDRDKLSGSSNVLINHDGAVVDHFPAFIPRGKSFQILDQLHKEIHWQREEVKFDGEIRKAARLVAVVGDPGTSYRYSGTVKEATAWHPVILDMKNQLEEKLGQKFNFVLCNWYEDGTHHIGWHSDDETDLLEGAIIASLSFGQTRDFLLAPKDPSKQDNIVSIPLTSGDLLCMRGTTQKLYRHSVQADSTARPRLNLTFRLIQYLAQDDSNRIKMVTPEPKPQDPNNKPKPEVKKPAGRGAGGKSRVQGRGW